ncbi:MAG: adenylate/guanylate cyclase domain-containing protein [Betaproteobacteria bacterium]|nr:adenylate/guanylate cyclase domain-containing protein [Betaproteobacteria bacterium]MDH4324654.1 adenylate/guanylate cyclase domain-containing protein [Betaproteobacteria bacterium]MDH5578698.1 adenylate/guanylate cyclase domain-containing protein [Betaproteobacteria bacterium]
MDSARIAQAEPGQPLSAAPRLPARVLRAIEAQRERSEILTGWVQAVIIAILATLYFVAPSTSPADVIFRPAPWAIGIYAAFTALRLRLEYTGRRPPGLRAVSVIVDMALLTVTIWGFHIEYGQPAAFYLKAPTFAYFFIFIALRTLSFSPATVLLAGACAALGWLALLLYALGAPGGMELVTRNYVEYMTAARILIGGEVDKIVSLLLVSGLLALAVLRSRQLLEQAATVQAAAAQMVRYFPPEVAEQLIQADELLKPGYGEAREAAAMFIDLRGFTRLSETLTPKELIALVGEFQHLAVPIIQRHHGAVITYLGDGIMVTFGAVRPTQTYAADALRCTEALIDRIGHWVAQSCARADCTPEVGIGVDVGTVICGTVGDEGKLEYAVLGEPVNHAAKLQVHTKETGVRALTTRLSLDKARAQGYASARSRELPGAQRVAGLDAPLELVAIA